VLLYSRAFHDGAMTASASTGSPAQQIVHETLRHQSGADHFRSYILWPTLKAL